jgi:hypothetical protein
MRHSSMKSTYQNLYFIPLPHIGFSPALKNDTMQKTMGYTSDRALGPFSAHHGLL